MTRQKKEIVKAIHRIDDFIDADMALGCGFAPAGAYADLEHERWTLLDNLARLSHYSSAEAMLYDDRHF